MEKPSHQEPRNEKPNFGADLMSYAEYAKVKHPQLYEYRLVAGDEIVDFLGVKHTNDPQDPIFQHIKDKLDNQKPDLIIVEGMPSINSQSRKDLQKRMPTLPDAELIQRYGEAFYTAKLAIDRGIKVVSPEPSDELAVQYIEQQGIPRDAIFAQRVSALIAQYDRTQLKSNIEAYVAPYLLEMSKQFKWDDYDFSLERFKVIHQEIFGVPYQPENLSFYKIASDPVPWEGKPYGLTNKASAAWGEYRDRYMVEQLQKYLNEFKKLFIVYGSAHALIQESALRKMMSDRVKE